MSEVTLEAIENLLELKLEEKLEAKFKGKLTPIQATLNNHTAILEQILTKKKAKTDNETVTAHRLDNVEGWAKKAGTKIGFEFEV